MNEENKPYKTFKQLLNNTSLQPKENDWENMQALLDKQLPPTGSQGSSMLWRNGFIGFCLVCVVAIMVFVLVKFGSEDTENKTAKNSQSAKVSALKKADADSDKKASSFTNKKTQPAIDSIQILGKKDSVVGADFFAKTKPQKAANNRVGLGLGKSDSGVQKGLLAADKKAKPNSETQALLNKKEKLKNKTKTKKATTIIESGDDQINGKNSSAHKGLNDKISSRADTLPKNKKDTNQQALLAGDISKKAATNGVNSRQNDIAKTTVTLQQNAINSNALPDSAKAKDSENKMANIIAKKAANNTATPTKKNFTSAPLPNPKFEYGFQLSPLQSGLNAGGKTILNPVPGFYAQYLVNDKLSLGAMLLPYSNTQLKSNNLYFSTSSTATGDTLNPATTSTTNYVVQNLYTLKTGIYIGYKISPHFSLEGGAGLVRILSGKGSTNVTTYRDSLLVFSKTSSYRVHPTDSAFSGIRKNSPFAYINAWYNINQWQIGIGFQQNFKSWINSGSGAPSSQVQLNFRYNLNFRKKGR